jgi:predicted O-methyltransferase YrrM
MLKLIRPGGLILVDNVLWYGQVADPEVTDNRTQSIRDLNDFMLADERVDFTIVPIGDGVAVCRVRDCQ